MKRICLNCRHYKVVDQVYGRCRVDRKRLAPASYPRTAHQDTCERWDDAGQHYYIRLGWLKSRAEAGVEGENG